MSDQSENIGELAGALAKAQGVIVNASKDRDNTFFKSSYATLASVWDSCRAALSANGLCVLQTTTETDKGLILTTTLAHASGQWVRSVYPVVPVKADPQGWGSAMTYARRYALSAMVGVAPADDDDGEAAVGRGGNGFDKLQKPTQVPPKQQPKKIEPPRRAELPPLPAKVTCIPPELFGPMPQLAHLVAVPLQVCTIDDLDLVIATVVATKQRFSTMEGLAWLTAIHAEAEHCRGMLEASAS